MEFTHVGYVHTHGCEIPMGPGETQYGPRLVNGISFPASMKKEGSSKSIYLTHCYIKYQVSLLRDKNRAYLTVYNIYIFITFIHLYIWIYDI